MQFRYLFVTLSLLFSFLPANFAQQQTVLRHGGVVHTVKFSPVDNALIGSAGDNNTIKLWNLRNDTVQTLRGHSGQVNAIAFSPNGQLLASGGDDWNFKLWDVDKRENIATLDHVVNRTRYQVKDVAFSPDGQRLATAAQHVKLWQVSTRSEIATLQHDAYVWTLAFSPNGQRLAAGDQGGTVKVWDVQKREVIVNLESDTTNVNAVTFSPDGRILATAGYDGQILLWSTANWSLLGTLQNWGTVYALDFSVDGKVLASTGYEVVTLWAVDSGEEVVSLKGHTGWVHATAFSPNGTTLISSGADGTVRVQNIETYLQTLQQREMVRLIYFLPINRRAQPNINTELDTLIKDAQQFYAAQMQKHGFGRKTFTFETDATGKAVVHRLNGKFRDRYYDTDTIDRVAEEVDKYFDLSKNLYLIVIDTDSELIDGEWCGMGGLHGTGGGKAIIPASGGCFDGEFGVVNTVHELGHAFGLDHDFQNDAYVMSYGTDRDRLSHCAAEWLDAHRYFNTSQTAFNEPTTMEMLIPLVFPGNTIRFRFEVADADRLHQAQLIIPTLLSDPAEGVKLHRCATLNGEVSLVEFSTTSVRPGDTTKVTLRVIDVQGNFTQVAYPVGWNDVARVDVNRDGVVNVTDLVLVASDFGTKAVRGAHPKPDVNNDGFVDRQDLLLVVDALEATGDVPAAPVFAGSNLQRWILEAKRDNNRVDDAAFQRGITILEQLLTPLLPIETVLLPNYPNPFNPETWIPYQLAEPANVTVFIYAADGQLVRALNLGHQRVGIYESRNRAAYWNGRNALGEPVASGLYFYTLTAGNFTATRKMLIRK